MNSGIPEEYAEKVIEIIYMTDNLNPSLEEITAEISKIGEWYYVGLGELLIQTTSHHENRRPGAKVKIFFHEGVAVQTCTLSFM